MGKLSVPGIKIYNPKFKEPVERMLKSPYLTEVSQHPGKPHVRAVYEKDGHTVIRVYDTKKGNHCAVSDIGKFVSASTEAPQPGVVQNVLMMQDFVNGEYTKRIRPTGEKNWQLIVKQPMNTPSVFGQSVNLLNWLSKDFVAQL